MKAASRRSHPWPAPDRREMIGNEDSGLIAHTEAAYTV
jgi:hypothetical protein